MAELLVRDRRAGALILLALLAALPILAGRVVVEQPNRAVELVLDLEETRVLARASGLEIGTLLGYFADAGVTSLAVKETTPLALYQAGRVWLAPGSELAWTVRAGRWLHPLLVRVVQEGWVRDGYCYLVVEEASTADWLERSLAVRLGADTVVRRSAEGLHLLGVPGGRERLEKVELGIDEAELALAEAAGLWLVPRFANYPGITAAAVEEAFAVARAAGKVSTVIFTGYEVLGYPGQLEATAAALLDGEITLGLVETPVQRSFIRQDGQVELAALTGYRVARVYSISRREIDKHLNPPRAVEMWVRSVKERNIRVLYLRPFLRPPAGYEGVDLVELNLGYIRDLTDELARAGFRSGPAVPFRPLRVPAWAALLVALGVTGGGLVLLGQFVDPGPRSRLALLGAGTAATVLLFAWRADLGIKVMALGASLVFPSLAVVALVRRWTGPVPGERRWFEPAADLLRASLVSLAGGLMVAAMMGDIRYLLEFEFFRGVKLAALVPPAFAALALVWVHVGPGRGTAWVGDLKRLADRLQNLLRSRMTVIHLVGLAVVTAVGLLYLGRTGHEAGIPVADWEIRLRSLLEQTLYARPRIKEFLLGHPAIMLGSWAAARGRLSLLGPAAVLGAVGQASLVNSFQHLRTPFIHSLLRTSNGLALGALGGLVLLAVLDLGLRLSTMGRSDR